MLVWDHLQAPWTNIPKVTPHHWEAQIMPLALSQLMDLLLGP